MDLLEVEILDHGTVKHPPFDLKLPVYSGDKRKIPPDFPTRPVCLTNEENILFRLAVTISLTAPIVTHITARDTLKMLYLKAGCASSDSNSARYLFSKLLRKDRTA